MYLHYFVPYILWNFIVLGLVWSWYRIEHVLDEQVDLVSVSWEAYQWKSHVRSTYWKLKSRVRLLVSRVSREKGQPLKLFVWRILNVTFLSFTHTIYTPITHKSMRGHSERKTLDRFSTTQRIHLLERESYSSLVRNHYSLFSFHFPLPYLERIFVPKHDPHIFRV